MKSIIAIIFALTCICLEIQECSSNQISTRLREVSEICREQEQTPHHLIEKLRSGDLDVNDMERLVMCHVKCMMEGFGVLENGGLSERVFVKKLGPHISESKAHELFDFCKDEASSNDDDDECERPFKIYICLKNLSDIFRY